jgi:ribose transport system permease protein
MDKNTALKNAGKRFYRSNATQLTLLAVMIVLCIGISILSPYFFQESNLMNILVAVSVSGTMAAGLTVVMLMGCIDLSQYSAMAFIGMVVGIALENGVNPWLAILLALVLGVAIGALNAFIATFMHIVPMIATISTMLIFRAAAYLAKNGTYARVTDPLFETIGYGKLIGINYLVFIMLAVFLVIGYILRNTTFGRKVYAVGGNQLASELSGINITKMKFLGFMISGATAGLAAVLLSAQVSAAMPTAGSGNEMDGIAAVFLGGVAFEGGKGKLFGTILGVLLLQILANGMTLLNVQPYFQQLTKGLVLLIAVYTDVLRGRHGRTSRLASL